MCDASRSVNWCCLPSVSLITKRVPSCRQLSLGSPKNTTHTIEAQDMTAEHSSVAGQARTYL